MARVQAKLEMELSGFGNGWTDRSADLAGLDGESADWGLPGASPRDRLAKTGEFLFSLRNDAGNLSGLVGAYSPDHPNVLSGFQEGIRVRYSQVVPGESDPFILHVGTLDSIQPDPDPLGGTMLVHCVAVDYMDDLARAPSSGVSTLLNVRDDEMFSALVAAVPRQPEAIQVTQGPDTFAVALDKVDATTRVSSVIQDICMSSLSLCYVSGQTLVYEPRSVRALSTTVVDTFDTNLVGLDVIRNRVNRINRVQGTAHPRAIDATPSRVLWSLAAGSSNAILVPSHTPIVIWTPYTDPTTHQAIGGYFPANPVAGVDYVFDKTFNSAKDGSGQDLTANLTIDLVPFGNTAKVTITNNGPDGYLIATTQLLGKGILDVTPVMLQADDEDSQINAGVSVLSYDAPYQADVATQNEIVLYLVNLYKGAATQIPKVLFHCPATDTVLAARLLRRQISDRIALGESLTGISTGKSFFINAIKVSADNRNNLTVEWLLAPADQTQYWLVEVPGRSELDQTTILGFGLVIGHTDSAHSDVHGDIAFEDVAHVDTHTDDAHQDAHSDITAHTDNAHTDVGHEDVAFTDVAHGDVAHVDSAHTDSAHADTAHTDTAHADSHSDVAHSDVAHADSHTDEAHADSPTTDSHYDKSPHFDAHSDSHTDAAHADTHSDVSHGDVAHSDVAHGDAHSDSAHSDTSHQDVAHLDSAHGDASTHGDVAHADSHTDVAHGDVAHVDTAHDDVAHSDAHDDVAHGDVN